MAFKTALSVIDSIERADYRSESGIGHVPIYELCADGHVRQTGHHNIYEDIQLLAKSCDSVERILALFTQTGDPSIIPSADGAYLDLTGIPDDPGDLPGYFMAVNAAASAAAAADAEADNFTAGDQPAESEVNV